MASSGGKTTARPPARRSRGAPGAAAPTASNDRTAKTAAASAALADCTAPAPPRGSADAPLPVQDLEGMIVRAPFATGTRSAREAFWLQTAEGRYLLRRKDGPGYGNDPQLEKLEGQRVVVCSGFLTGYQVLAEQLKPKKP